MSSSELSDALNPFAGHPRSRQSVQNYLDPFQQNVIGPHDYAPHRSELELAIPESQPPPVGLLHAQLVSQPMRGPSTATAHPMHELVRALRATKEAQAQETQRRMAWEQEQEVKYRQRQVEMEQQINEMRRQITLLQSALAQSTAGAGHSGSPAITINDLALSPECPPSMNGSHPTSMFNPQYNMSPAILPSQPQQSSQSISPISPVPLNLPSYTTSHFVQDSPAAPRASTTQPYYDGSVVDDYQTHQRGLQMHHRSPHLQQLQNQQYHDAQNPSTVVPQNLPSQLSNAAIPPLLDSLPPPQSASPSPSPLIGSTEVPQSPRSPHSPSTTHASSRSSRKRSNVDIASSDSGSDSDNSEAYPNHRIRRVNHHDRRCLTIHHAMRAHLLRMMQVDTDKELPDSHAEGVALGLNDPVRFVWDKTTKQSVHNGRMKTRIMNNIRENSKLYKHVPRKDFNKKTLDAVFEQCFVTFRQKFRAQRDALTAQNLKKREDAKARRARHVSRRKIKLSNRAESRDKIAAVEHVTFDGALQVECMSSEESDYETDASGNRISILRTRGYAWRSQRLNRFYNILDEGIPNKIKRGAGKKERCGGPLKEGFYLPPKGVASWMISKRWMKAAQREHSDLPSVLRKLIEEPPRFEWSQLGLLGDDSEDEPDAALPRPHNTQPQPVIQHPHPHQPQPHQPAGFHIPQTMNLNYSPRPNLTIPQQHYSTGISSLDYALSS